MSCWSCLFYRGTKCALKSGWFPKRCEEFVYEPGTDEEERNG